MANRLPRFESHIRPMMRRLDRDAMVAARAFDLWSYDDVRSRAERILKRLKKGVDGASGAMPPPTAGGPWPEEWVTLFERWMTLGFPTWLEPVFEPDETLHFVLHREPPAVPGDGSAAFSATIDFADDGVRTLLVVDANGSQRVDFSGV
jgi:hypothetical protein